MEQGFESLGLDVRITKALAKEGFIRATEIQKQSIPQVISRSDVLVQAATGSGKTLCFALPVLHNILVSAHTHGIQALVLVPTRELCNQVGRVFTQISHFCTDCISITELGAPGASLASEAVRIRENPRIVISTPGRIVKHLKLNNLNLKESLRMLVIDEADMVLSYGYQEDLKLILSHIPSLRQTILTSATLSPEVDSLKALVLQKPVVFKLHSDALDEDGKFKLEHFYVEITERSDSDAFLFAFALLKLGVLSGKTLFFVNEIDRSYRLKLFLEAFGVTSAVLNAELPFNSRVRVLDHFNKGMFDVLIATDKGFDGEEKEDEKEEESGDEKEAKDEFGAARGIDFKNVSNVINFDFPRSLKSYIHRAGRTARGFAKGICLSFVKQGDESLLEMIAAYYSSVSGLGLSNEGVETKAAVNPLNYNPSVIDGFRYRVEDVLRGVTKLAIRDARVKEIKAEILASNKLKAHFEDNPRELALLQHNRVLRPKAVQHHLKGVPKYLVPEQAIETISKPAIPGAAPKKLRRGNKKRKHRNDPLKTFKVAGTIPEAGEIQRRPKRRKY